MTRFRIMQQIQCIDAESRDQSLFIAVRRKGVETACHKDSCKLGKRFRRLRFSRSGFVEKFNELFFYAGLRRSIRFGSSCLFA